MATLPKVLINQADSNSAGGVALRVRTQARSRPSSKSLEKTCKSALLKSVALRIIIHGWVASTAAWIAESMGEAALSRFLDRSAGFAGFYRRAINEEHNRAVSLLNLYRTNLRSL